MQRKLRAIILQGALKKKSKIDIAILENEIG
jgi:hypothetical protein